MADLGATTALSILVDGDACPVKQEVFDVAWRYGVPVTVVANQFLRLPDHPLIQMKTVSRDFDAADDWIVEQAGPDTIVVTGDILLADRALKAGAAALSNSGKAYTEDSIGGLVAQRAIMADLRAGMINENAGSPPPFTKADRSRFRSALDQCVTRLQRQRSGA